MKRINYLIISLLAITIYSCSTATKKSDDTPTISVSIFPVKNIIDRLTDSHYKVNVMIPKEIGHSDYSPTAQQMKELTNSKAYMAIGPLDFELTWGERLRSASPDIQWIDLSEGIELMAGHHHHDDEGDDDHHDHHDHHHHGEAYDPHYWMSPKAASIMVSNISEHLIALNPSLEPIITANHNALQQELSQMSEELQQVYNINNNITFMIYHPALGYLARDYGFTQLEIEEDGKTPTPAGLKRIIEEAKQKYVKLLFIQKNFNINNAKVAAEEIGAKIVQINPESEEWMEEIKLITGCLKEIQ